MRMHIPVAAGWHSWHCLQCCWRYLASWKKGENQSDTGSMLSYQYGHYIEHTVEVCLIHSCIGWMYNTGPKHIPYTIYLTEKERNTSLWELFVILLVKLFSLWRWGSSSAEPCWLAEEVGYFPISAHQMISLMTREKAICNSIRVLSSTHSGALSTFIFFIPLPRSVGTRCGRKICLWY